MPRTTLNIDESALRKLKRKREVEGRSLGEIASEAIERGLSEGGGDPTKAAPLLWHTRDLKPRIDLSDPKTIHDLLEADDLERLGAK